MSDTEEDCCKVYMKISLLDGRVGMYFKEPGGNISDVVRIIGRREWLVGGDGTISFAANNKIIEFLRDSADMIEDEILKNENSEEDVYKHIELFRTIHRLEMERDELKDKLERIEREL